MTTLPSNILVKPSVANIFTGLALLSFAATSALSQQLPRIKPGGWQYETTVGNTAIPGLPPEAAAMLDKAINKVTKAKFCITPEDSENFARQLTHPGGSQECEFKNVLNRGTTYQWEMHCPTGADRGGFSSTATMEKPSEDAFTMKAQTTIESRRGNVTTNVTTKGSFLGADCKATGAKTYREIMGEAKERLQDLSAQSGAVLHRSK